MIFQPGQKEDRNAKNPFPERPGEKTGRRLSTFERFLETAKRKGVKNPRLKRYCRTPVLRDLANFGRFARRASLDMPSTDNISPKRKMESNILLGETLRRPTPDLRLKAEASVGLVKTRAQVVAYKDAGLSRSEALDAETDRLKMVFPKLPHETARRQAEKNIGWLFGKPK